MYYGEELQAKGRNLSGFRNLVYSILLFNVFSIIFYFTKQVSSFNFGLRIVIVDFFTEILDIIENLLIFMTKVIFFLKKRQFIARFGKIVKKIMSSHTF